MPVRGDIRSVQVPGAVDGWLALHERYGTAAAATTCWRRPSSWPTDGFPASIMLALASHLVHAVARRRRAVPGRPARHRADGPAARHRPHAARHRPRRARRLLRGRVRTRSAGPRATATSRRTDFATSAASWCAPLRVHGLGPRAVDRAAAVAGLPDAGRRRGGRDGRARHRSRRPAVGPPPRRDVARRRPRPPGRALRRRGRRRPARSRTAWPRRPPGSAARHGATRRGARARHHRPRRGPLRRRRHHPPVRAGCRRARRVARRSPTRWTSARTSSEPTHRRLPAQPRRGLLTGPGSPGRGGARAAAPAHALPHARDRDAPRDGTGH